MKESKFSYDTVKKNSKLDEFFVSGKADKKKTLSTDNPVIQEDA